jgi:hypothetical protein
MNLRTPLRTRLTLAATLVVGTGLALAGVDAVAGERSPGAQRAMPRGDYQRHTERARTENGHVRRDTWTGAGGRSATRDATVVRDREAGTRTREATTTLPGGRTRSTSDVTTRTDDGYVRETTLVKPNGATLERDVVATRDAETGRWTKDVAVDRTPAPKPVPPAPGG